MSFCSKVQAVTLSVNRNAPSVGVLACLLSLALRADQTYMLSQTVEYALRAAVYLADQAPTPRTNEQIADTTKVPQAYLSKVMQSLTRAKLVRSQRGIHGGFVLSRSPQDITILEVVNAVDPLQRITTCPLGIVSHGSHLCPLHRRLDVALEAVEAAFGKTTLAEVLSEPSRSVPLCGMVPRTPVVQPLEFGAASPKVGPTSG